MFKTCKFSISKGKTHTNKHYTITLNRGIGLNFVSVRKNMHTKHYSITLRREICLKHVFAMEKRLHATDRNKHNRIIQLH